jgi:aminoglycoside 3-N-acetyltransferase
MFSVNDLADDLKKLPLRGRVVGVHSKPSAIGDIAPAGVSPDEAARGMKPIFKTLINAFLEALGPQGTLFVPTHSNNHLGNPQYAGDALYYHPARSPSNVGSLTQSFVFDDRAVRSRHPTHSTAAIGPEARYLAQGHGPDTQPVGIHNAFSKAAGLDGIILFIGDVL